MSDSAASPPAMNPSAPHSASPQKLLPSLENCTILKERPELRLLIAELKDRVKELTLQPRRRYQRQLLAWEDDWQKMLTLAERCSLLNNELNKGNEIKSPTKRLKFLESQQNDRKTTLENTQQNFKKMSQKGTDAIVHCQALEEKNKSLYYSVLELSAKMGQLQAREQELLTMLKLKDKAILEATDDITEFTSKFRELESALRAAKTEEFHLNKEKQDLKMSLKELILEINKLKDDLCEKMKENNKQQEEIIHLKQENVCLRTELALLVEKTKRKDQLQFAKSKEAWTNTELPSLRQIYVKQQRDLQFLHVSLESSQELRQNHEKAAHERSEENMDLNSFHSDAPFLTSTQKEGRPQRYEKFSGQGFPLKINNLLVPEPANRCCSAAMDQDTSSPISKLQHVLAESRQMVADLELSTLLCASPRRSPDSGNDNTGVRRSYIE
ncbi:coiled-coil domain-containing protein 62 isoform X2 [Falco rusticolus]|uniref:coiled-coil domain-containing protein 62 isoform X2 n=1 Tax=Falco cherrug TaxID=345164 RepID=UPI000FFBBC22|nr:coiled-coil domain-containing protein 62 isoform X2 [Falco cherrug]XP_037231321.1 coiled-coil domain-containing protein 62 isoform X2 [Falco rusticolus]